MEYNKTQFSKTADKKVLHKIKKHWVVLSTALLMALAGGATLIGGTSANADTANSNSNHQNDQTSQIKKQLNTNLTKSYQNAHQTSNAQNQNQSGQKNQTSLKQINNQASVLHNRIVANATQGAHDANSTNGRVASHNQNQTQTMNVQSVGLGATAQQGANNNNTGSAQGQNVGAQEEQVNAPQVGSNSVSTPLAFHNAPITVAYADGNGVVQMDASDKPRVGAVNVNLSGNTNQVGVGFNLTGKNADQWSYTDAYYQPGQSGRDGGHQIQGNDGKYYATQKDADNANSHYHVEQDFTIPSDYQSNGKDDFKADFSQYDYNWEKSGSVQNIDPTTLNQGTKITLPGNTKYAWDSYNNRPMLILTPKVAAKNIDVNYVNQNGQSLNDVWGQDGQHDVIPGHGNMIDGVTNKDPQHTIQNSNTRKWYATQSDADDATPASTQGGHYQYQGTNGQWYASRQHALNVGNNRYGDYIDVTNANEGGIVNPDPADYSLKNPNTKQEYRFNSDQQNVSVPVVGKAFQADNSTADNGKNAFTVNVKFQDGDNDTTDLPDSFSITRYLGGNIGSTVKVTPQEIGQWVKAAETNHNIKVVDTKSGNKAIENNGSTDSNKSSLTLQQLATDLGQYSADPSNRAYQVYFQGDEQGHGVMMSDNQSKSLDAFAKNPTSNVSAPTFTFDAGANSAADQNQVKGYTINYYDQNNKLVSTKNVAANTVKDMYGKVVDLSNGTAYGKTDGLTYNDNDGLNIPNGYTAVPGQNFMYHVNSNGGNLDFHIVGNQETMNANYSGNGSIWNDVVNNANGQTWSTTGYNNDVPQHNHQAKNGKYYASSDEANFVDALHDGSKGTKDSANGYNYQANNKQYYKSAAEASAVNEFSQNLQNALVIKRTVTNKTGNDLYIKNGSQVKQGTADATKIANGSSYSDYAVVNKATGNVGDSFYVNAGDYVPNNPFNSDTLQQSAINGGEDQRIEVGFGPNGIVKGNSFSDGDNNANAGGTKLVSSDGINVTNPGTYNYNNGQSTQVPIVNFNYELDSGNAKSTALHHDYFHFVSASDPTEDVTQMFGANGKPTGHQDTTVSDQGASDNVLTAQVPNNSGKTIYSDGKGNTNATQTGPYQNAINNGSDYTVTGANAVKVFEHNVPEGYQFVKVLGTGGDTADNGDNTISNRYRSVPNNGQSLNGTFGNADQNEVIEVVPKVKGVTVKYVDQNSKVKDKKNNKLSGRVVGSFTIPGYYRTANGQMSRAGEQINLTSPYSDLSPADRISQQGYASQVTKGATKDFGDDLVDVRVPQNYHITQETGDYTFNTPGAGNETNSDVYNVMVAGNSDQADTGATQYTATVNIHELDQSDREMKHYSVPDEIDGDIDDNYTVNADSFQPAGFGSGNTALDGSGKSTVTGWIEPKGLSQGQINFYYKKNTDTNPADLQDIFVTYYDNGHQLGYSTINPDMNNDDHKSYDGQQINITDPEWQKGNADQTKSDGLSLPMDSDGKSYQIDPNQQLTTNFSDTRPNSLQLNVYDPDIQLSQDFTIHQKLGHMQNGSFHLDKTQDQTIQETGYKKDHVPVVGYKQDGSPIYAKNSFTVNPADYQVNGYAEEPAGIVNGSFTNYGINPSSDTVTYVAKSSSSTNNDNVGPKTNSVQPIYVQYVNGANGQNVSDSHKITSSDSKSHQITLPLTTDPEHVSGTAPLPNNYRLVAGQILNFTIDNSVQHIRVYVTPFTKNDSNNGNQQTTAQPITVHFLDNQTGDQIGNSDVLHGKDGTQYDPITNYAHVPSGYQLVPGQNVNFTVSKYAQTASLYVESTKGRQVNPNDNVGPDQGSVQPIYVRYVNGANGSQIGNSDTLTSTDGQAITLPLSSAENNVNGTAPLPTGYQLVDGQDTNYTFMNSTQHVTMYVIPSQDNDKKGSNTDTAQPITVHFINDQNGKQVGNSDVLKGNDGTVYDPITNSAHVPSGYHLLPGQNLNFTVGNETQDVHLLVEGAHSNLGPVTNQPQPIYVQYWDGPNHQVGSSERVDGTLGEVYNDIVDQAPIPKVNGVAYQLTPNQQLSYTISGQTQRVNLNLTKVNHSNSGNVTPGQAQPITVRYVDVDSTDSSNFGKVLNGNGNSVTGSLGDSITLPDSSAEVPNGYQLVPNQDTSYKIEDQAQNVTLYVIKNHTKGNNGSQQNTIQPITVQYWNVSDGSKVGSPITISPSITDPSKKGALDQHLTLPNSQAPVPSGYSLISGNQLSYTFNQYRQDAPLYLTSNGSSNNDLDKQDDFTLTTVKTDPSGNPVANGTATYNMMLGDNTSDQLMPTSKLYDTDSTNYAPDTARDYGELGSHGLTDNSSNGYLQLSDRNGSLYANGQNLNSNSGNDTFYYKAIKPNTALGNVNVSYVDESNGKQVATHTFEPGSKDYYGEQFGIDSPSGVNFGHYTTKYSNDKATYTDSTQNLVVPMKLGNIDKSDVPLSATVVTISARGALSSRTISSDDGHTLGMIAKLKHNPSSSDDYTVKDSDVLNANPEFSGLSLGVQEGTYHPDTALDPGGSETATIHMNSDGTFDPNALTFYYYQSPSNANEAGDLLVHFVDEAGHSVDAANGSAVISGNQGSDAAINGQTMGSNLSDIISSKANLGLKSGYSLVSMQNNNKGTQVTGHPFGYHFNSQTPQTVTVVVKGNHESDNTFTLRLIKHNLNGTTSESDHTLNGAEGSQFAPLSGNEGTYSTVRPSAYTPNGYHVDSGDGNVSVYFESGSNVDKFTPNSAVFNYDQNVNPNASDMVVRYWTRSGKGRNQVTNYVGGGRISGLDHFGDMMDVTATASDNQNQFGTDVAGVAVPGGYQLSKNSDFASDTVAHNGNNQNPGQRLDYTFNSTPHIINLMVEGLQTSGSNVPLNIHNTASDNSVKIAANAIGHPDDSRTATVKDNNPVGSDMVLGPNRFAPSDFHSTLSDSDVTIHKEYKDLSSDALNQSIAAAKALYTDKYGSVNGKTDSDLQTYVKSGTAGTDFNGLSQTQQSQLQSQAGNDIITWSDAGQNSQARNAPKYLAFDATKSNIHGTNDPAEAMYYIGKTYVTPSSHSFNYDQNDSEAAPLTLVYLNQDGNQVGTDTISGDLDQVVNVTDPGEGGEAVPTGYSLDGNPTKGTDNKVSLNGQSTPKSNVLVGGNQTLDYGLTNKKQTVYLHVHGANNNVGTMKVRIIEHNANGSVNDYTVSDWKPTQSDDMRAGATNLSDGDTFKIDPNAESAGKSVFGVDFTKYHAAPSDSVQYGTIGQDGKLNPGEVTFEYNAGANTGVGYANIHYVTSDGTQVGETYTSDGQVDKSVNYNHVPNGYTVAGGQNYNFSSTPSELYIKVNGQTVTPKNFTIYTVTKDQNGNLTNFKSHTFKISGKNSTVPVGTTVHVTPFGGYKNSSGAYVIDNSGSYDNKNNFAFMPSNGVSHYHVDANDQDYDLTVQPNGDIGPTNSITYIFDKSINSSAKTGAIKVHYYDPSNGNKDVDVVEDHGIVGQDHFDVQPYLDDLPDSISNDYHLNGDAKYNLNYANNGSLNGATSSQAPSDYKENEQDVYIPITPNGPGDQNHGNHVHNNY